MRKHSRAFLSFDMLFSILPIMLIVVYVILFQFRISENANNAFEKQKLFDKLTSISELTVNNRAARVDGDTIYPGWVLEEDFSTLSLQLSQSMKLNELSISFDENKRSGGMCIYRIVAFGEQKEIRKLYFCGS